MTHLCMPVFEKNIANGTKRVGKNLGKFDFGNGEVAGSGSTDPALANTNARASQKAERSLLHPLFGEEKRETKRKNQPKRYCPTDSLGDRQKGEKYTCLRHSVMTSRW